MNSDNTTLCSSFGRGMAPSGYLVTDRAQRAEPFTQPRPTGTNHHQRVRSAGHENLEDLGKSEQPAAYFVHVVAAL